MDFLIETRYCIPLLEAHFFWNQLRGSLLGSQSKLITNKGKQRWFKNRTKLMIFSKFDQQWTRRSTGISLNKCQSESSDLIDKLKPKETESFMHHTTVRPPQNLKWCASISSCWVAHDICFAPTFQQKQNLCSGTRTTMWSSFCREGGKYREPCTLTFAFLQQVDRRTTNRRD